MFDWIYEWIKNLCFYMILVSAFLKVLPGKEYDKYIQFFSGVVLILLLLTPILRLSGMEDSIFELYQSNEYKMEKKEIEMMEKYFQEADILDFIPEEYSETKDENIIEIEPVEIGEQTEHQGG